MTKKFFIQIGLLLSAVVMTLISWQFGRVLFDILAQTLIAITLFFFLFKVLLEELISARISDLKTRYSVRKTSSVLFVAISLLVLLHIWGVDAQTLLVSYGLVGAGAAIALQDIFKNIAGGLLLFTANVYQVGDRIEVGGIHGDVIDIGVMNTAVLEIRNWVDGDQPTGRISMIPNGNILWKDVHNYSKDHGFIWDELMIPVTYDSDWKKAGKMMEASAEKYTKDTVKKADKQLKSIAKKYYVPEKNTDPIVYVTPTDNWITLRLRYICPILERRAVKNDISRDVLAKIQKAKGIDFASATMTITNVYDDEGR